MLSLVVPIYNSEETIGKCIESIQLQTFSDIELILVDDGSTDNSGRICDDYAVNDDRIKVIHQENKGRTEARWQGVQQANGSWVTFVDSDDMLPKDALANLYEKADDETDIVLGNGQELPDERREVIPMEDFRHLTVRGDGTIGVPWGSLYRRSCLTAYLFDLPREIMMGEDYIFWLRLVLSTEKPVKVVYKNVYTKGDDHTSNCFPWTAAYAQRINELRVSSIPQEQRHLYFHDILHDRVDNLFAVAVYQSRREWKKSPFYQEILKDTTLSLKQRLFLAIPSLKLRRWLSR